MGVGTNFEQIAVAPLRDENLNASTLVIGV